MEKEIEARLRSRYTFIDRTDQASIMAAQQAGIPLNDDGELVGESDGSGVWDWPSHQPGKTSSFIHHQYQEARDKDQVEGRKGAFKVSVELHLQNEGQGHKAISVI